VNFRKTSIVFIFLLYFFSLADFSFAQEKPKPKPKPNTALIKAQAEIDSLNNEIANTKAAYEGVTLGNKRKDSIINELDVKIQKMQNINNDLEGKLSTYKGDNLKLDQSNRILIIFNAIVGVLLLTTLIWFLRNIGRKKTPDKNKSIPDIDISDNSNKKIQPSSKNDHQFFDMRLEQLEKLGELKNKGVLNEEEFNRQKQQILGNG
jgi:hypothetical protein